MHRQEPRERTSWRALLALGLTKTEPVRDLESAYAQVNRLNLLMRLACTREYNQYCQNREKANFRKQKRLTFDCHLETFLVTAFSLGS